MSETKRETAEPLRVLIANEHRDRLGWLANIVVGLGHDVISREVEVAEVGAVTVTEHPDVALVWLGLSPEHALELIGAIVHHAACPVIALLGDPDPEFVRQAARRGVFAAIADSTPEELQSAIETTLERFAEYQSLQGAFGRRALIEQAKGILMARHSVDGNAAFAMLRAHSQQKSRRLVEIAEAIVDSHLLLATPDKPASRASGKGGAARQRPPGSSGAV